MPSQIGPSWKFAIPAVLLAAAVVTFYFASERTARAQPGKPDPKVLSYTLPDDIPWQVGENNDRATLPSGEGITVEMIRWHAGNMSRPHMHDTTRYITVLEGTWWLGWGPDYDPDSTFPVTKGSYVVHHANQLHYDGAKDEDATILIITMEDE